MNGDAVAERHKAAPGGNDLDLVAGVRRPCRGRVEYLDGTEEVETLSAVDGNREHATGRHEAIMANPGRVR